jgi:hypothetical protein
MPEIWLRYGSTYSILDIRSENLLKHYRVDMEPMKQEQVKDTLKGLDGRYDGIVLLDTSEVALNVVGMLRDNGIADDVYTVRADMVKNRGMKYLSKLEGRLVFVSRASVDPIFGYSCTLSKLVRSNAQMMNAVYADHIKRGVIDPHDHISRLDGTAIELLYNDSGLLALSLTDVDESYDAVRSMLVKQELDYSKACIVTPSVSDTLDDALLALWNTISHVKDDGIIVLLAECRKGFSRALRMLIEGTSNYDGYVEGLEYVKIMSDAKSRYELCLVTMLPDAYIKRLGLIAFRSLNDALQYILKRGKQKVMVVSDAEIIDVRRDYTV